MWREQLELLPRYLGAHLRLSVTALVIGIALSLALSFLAVGRRALQVPLLALASVVQTIPGLALLALMVPLLGRIGFAPALIALVLYSMLPVLRNAITGLEEVQPSLIQAGVALGMTPAQVLWRVRLPLALPVIVAGIRTATVWVVGTATLSTPVGATSLGNYIFSGLQTQNTAAVLVGCAAVATLAIVLDLLIRAVELALRRRSRALAAVAAAGIVAVLLGGSFSAAWSRADDRGRPLVTLGTKTFTEQYLLGGLIGRRLEERGFRVRRLESLGSTVVFEALVAGQIDLYVDYTGTIWANHMHRRDNPGAERTLAEVSAWVAAEHGMTCLGPLGFENAYALAMRRGRARELGASSLADLAARSPELAIGGDYEFFSRPEWEAVREAYGLRFRERRSFDSTLMYAAVAAGEVDVISAFSTDGRIAAYDLVVFEDPREALPPYDAVLLLSASAARRADLVAALEGLIGAIDDDTMRRANKWVDVDGAGITEAAERLAAELTPGR